MTSRHVEVVRVDHTGSRARGHDAAAVEEPLQVRVNGEPFAVIMRTPGADRELAAGFVFAEGLVDTASGCPGIETARRGTDSARHNVVDVTIVGLDQARRDAARRRVTTASSCGLCGRQTIESLTVRAPRIDSTLAVDPACLTELPGRMRAAQHGFDATGGASFEIVQKALLARVPVVVAVSAPSTLAVDLALESGMTLVGFARDGRFNIYTHPQRVREPSTPNPEPQS